MLQLGIIEKRKLKRSLFATVKPLCLVTQGGVLHLISPGEGYGSLFASPRKDFFKRSNDARKGFVVIDEDKMGHQNLQQSRGRMELKVRCHLHCRLWKEPIAMWSNFGGRFHLQE